MIFIDVPNVSNLAQQMSSNRYYFVCRQELESLQTQVNVEREKYQQNAQTSSVSAIPALCINDMFTLSQVTTPT